MIGHFSWCYTTFSLRRCFFHFIFVFQKWSHIYFADFNVTMDTTTVCWLGKGVLFQLLITTSQLIKKKVIIISRENRVFLLHLILYCIFYNACYFRRTFLTSKTELLLSWSLLFRNNSWNNTPFKKIALSSSLIGWFISSPSQCLNHINWSHLCLQCKLVNVWRW
jgi:hypothetical protein